MLQGWVEEPNSPLLRLMPSTRPPIGARLLLKSITPHITFSIKSIKMYGWEQSFTQSMEKVRQLELSKLKVMAFYGAANAAVFVTAPAIIAVVTFAVYVERGRGGGRRLPPAYTSTISISIAIIVVIFKPPFTHHPRYTIDNEMTASKAFTAILLFGMLRMPLIFYPMVLIQFVAARESWRRIDAYVSLDEIQNDYYAEAAHEDVAMAITDASFSWGLEEPEADTEAIAEGKGKGKKSDKVEAADLEAGADGIEKSSRNVTARVLNNVNVTVTRGELVAVVGRVGSGKTALAAAFLGELKKHGGAVNVNGSVALMAQSPWSERGRGRYQ